MTHSPPQTPFMFATSDGTLLDVRRYPIVSDIGWSYLLKQAQALPSSSPSRKAVEQVDAFLKTLPRRQTFSPTRKNDLNPSDQVYITDVLNANSNNLYNSYKTCVYVFLPGPKKSAFKPSEMLATSSPQPRDFGWSGIKGLEKAWKEVALFAKNNDVAFPPNALSTINKAKKAWKAGSLVARLPQPEVDLARNEVFVLLHLEGGKYLTYQGMVGTLAQARLFETRQSAEDHIEKRLRGNYKTHKTWEVVQAQLRLTQDAIPNLPPDKHVLFQEALAQMQKEQLTEALKESTISVLRRRLEELEQDQGVSVPPPTSSPKKKM